MITEKAYKLKTKAIQASYLNEDQEYRKYSHECFKEIFENCKPTKEEFSEFSSGLIIFADTVWNLIEYIIENNN